MAEALGWRVVDNELVEEVAARAGLPPADVAEREERVPSFAERLARTLVAATPGALSPPGAGRHVPKLQETDLVRITETVVAEVAAKGRAVLVGRAAPAVLARERDSLHVQLVAPRRLANSGRRRATRRGSAEEAAQIWTRPTAPGRGISASTTGATGTTPSTITWC